MDKREKLISYFNSEAYIPLKIRELKIVLDVPDEDAEAFSELVAKLEADGEIVISKRGNILPIKKSEDKYVGVLHCNPNGRFGFVVGENIQDMYVSSSDMGNALNGDKVLVKKIGTYNNKPECSVIKVIERNTDALVGIVITRRSQILRVRPDDKKYFRDIEVSSGNSLGAAVGQRVCVEELYFKPNGNICGKITKILGESDDLRSLVDSIVIRNKIKPDFDFETISECECMDDSVKFNENEREDFRNLTIFTIDGETARDFDDAVSIQMITDDTYRLGVHIADVSEYVRESSATDREALIRGTSVYLPDRVIPMLPEKLSNKLCSLVPGEDRLTLSVIMDIDKTGKVINHRIAKSIIKSVKRLTYNEVNILLEDVSVSQSDYYKDVYNDLVIMSELASVLRSARMKRGAIDFDFPETEIIADSDGNPVDVKIVERGVSNRMIEEFMLIANETVAEFAYWAEIPCIYRSHEPPSSEKLSSFIEFLKPLHLSIKGKFDESNPIKPKAFEQILNKVKDTPIEGIVSKTMLRSLMKADYKSGNTGHFGLAAEYYCHFTSPIRRYPDLIVHRNIKRLLDNEDLSGIDTSHIAKRATDCELKAEQCERDCDDLMKAVYMSYFIGKDFEGVVSGVTNFGMFVELENGIEGLIRLENISDDYYLYDETSNSLTGERTGKRYTLGDTVVIMMANSDILSGKIDFVLSTDADTYLNSMLRKEKRNKRRRK